MRIRHLVFSLGIGGTERAAQNLAIGTAKRGHETELIALLDGPRKEALISSGVNVRIVGHDAIASLRTPNAVDALIIHSHGLDGDIVSNVIQLSGRPKIAEINVFSEPTPWMPELDVSFQLSPWAHWLYAQRGGDAQRSSTLSYPVESSGFFRDSDAGRGYRDEHRIPHDAFVIGRIGQPYEGKWSPWLVNSFRELQQAGDPLHLLLIGAPPSVVEAAHPLVSQGRATVVAKVIGDDRLRGAYNAMDVFAHSAQQGESFGYVLAEAALCELPIVTMATPWADNSQGWVAGSSASVTVTPRGFTQAIRQLIATMNQRERVACGRSGRQHVMESFAIDTVVDQMLSVLFGHQKMSRLPAKPELDDEMYQGLEHSSLRRFLSLRPNSRIGGPISGQESWRWFLTGELNARGISRNVFGRR